MSRTKAELEDALHWVLSEIQSAGENPAYKKETLISNVGDRVSAALQVGPYRVRAEDLTEKEKAVLFEGGLLDPVEEELRKLRALRDAAKAYVEAEDEDRIGEFDAPVQAVTDTEEPGPSEEERMEAAKKLLGSLSPVGVSPVGAILHSCPDLTAAVNRLADVLEKKVLT